MKEKGERIVLGSGKTYIKEFTETVTDISQIVDEMQKDEYLVGLIQGGASVEYKPESYTAEDDLGIASKTILTKEEVTFKTGVMTFCGNTLAQLCSTARVTEDREKGLRIVKIGGSVNDNGKIYVILFAHLDAKDGNIYVAIVGKNTSGFTLAFAKDKETVIDAEFKAESMDDVGTKIIYAEEIPKAAASLAIASVEGSKIGHTALTISPPKDSGNRYFYKIGVTELPYLGDRLSAEWVEWDGIEELAAETGGCVIVVETDANGLTAKAGMATITAKEDA